MDARPPTPGQIDLLIGLMRKVAKKTGKRLADEARARAIAESKDRDWIRSKINGYNAELGWSPASPATQAQLAKIVAMGGDAYRGMTWKEAGAAIDRLVLLSGQSNVTDIRTRRAV